MEEVAVDLREGLLALAVGAGLQVMQAMFEAAVTAVAGPRSKHDRERTAVRHGCGPGSVTLGGRRMPVSRPRVRSADGSAELPVPSYELFSSTEVLGRMALERMLGGLPTRRYGLGLEPVGEQVSQTATSTSKSAVSRRFVAATETALAELLAHPLHEVDLVALMVDGVGFGEHLCVVALGIDADGSTILSRWWRTRRRTPPWCAACSSGCASPAWTPLARSWWSSTGPRPSPRPSARSSTSL